MLKRLFIVLILFFCIKAEAKIVGEKVYIVPVGKVDRAVVEKLRADLLENLPIPAKIGILPEEKLPKSAYDESRRQYVASLILKYLSKRIILDVRDECILAVVDADIYEEGLNFVFGLAQSKNRICIISLARLRNEFYGLKPDEKLFSQRALKEAAHELGHTWKVSDHCPNKRCVMHFSNSISDTDKKTADFCAACKGRLPVY
jgi:archaemetzincin